MSDASCINYEQKRGGQRARISSSRQDGPTKARRVGRYQLRRQPDDGTGSSWIIRTHDEGMPTPVM